MKTYEKIETLFKRDLNGNKQLIYGAYRNETVYYLRNNEWIFTEKIDGTNIRVMWDGHTVSFGGRTDRADIPKHLMEFLTDKFGSQECHEIFEQVFGEKEVILFGEGYGPKIQNGGAYRSDVSFILFDVWVGDHYVGRSSVEHFAQAFNVDVVPIVLKGTIDDGIKYVKSHSMSTIGTAPMEGVVGRPENELCDRFGNRVIIKIKQRDFLR